MGLLKKWFGPPTHDAFAEIVQRELRRRGETRPVKYVAEDFSLRFEGPDTRTMFLHNMYADYLRAGRRGRAALLNRYFAISTSPRPGSDTFEASRDSLLPRIRERFYHEAAVMQIRVTHGKAPKFATRVLAEHLTLELVQDSADTIVILSQKVLNDWGKTFDEVLPIARDNLWKRSNENFVRLGPSLYCSPWRDSHDASRMFLHDLIWQLPVKGQHVAMIPNRDVLFIGGTEDADGLCKMVELVEEAMKLPRPMTALAFRLNGSIWEPFLPEPQSHAYEPLLQMAAMSIARDYSEQKSALEKRLAKEGEDVYVASQIVKPGPAGRLVTLTTWVRDVTNGLLPHAEWLAFVSGDEVLGAARWEDAHRVCGHRMELTDHYPARYRVRTFPDESELSILTLREPATIFAE